MTTMNMCHQTKRISRAIGLIILTMDQPDIVMVIIEVMMMVLTHNLGPHQMAMKPKTISKMKMRTPCTRLETVNQYLKMETTSQKLRNAIICARRKYQTTPIRRHSDI